MSAVEMENQALAGTPLGLQRLKAIPHDHGNCGPTGQETPTNTRLEHSKFTARQLPSKVKRNLLLLGVPQVCLPGP